MLLLTAMRRLHLKHQTVADHGLGDRNTPSNALLRILKKKTFKHVSCKFDEFRVDTYVYELRDTPAALSYGCCQGEQQQFVKR